MPELLSPLVSSQSPPARPIDVCSPRHCGMFWEIKSSPLDVELTQEALCRRFHWLIARQILFRRRQIL